MQCPYQLDNDILCALIFSIEEEWYLQCPPNSPVLNGSSFNLKNWVISSYSDWVEKYDSKTFQQKCIDLQSKCHLWIFYCFRNCSKYCSHYQSNLQRINSSFCQKAVDFFANTHVWRLAFFFMEIPNPKKIDLLQIVACLSHKSLYLTVSWQVY